MGVAADGAITASVFTQHLKTIFGIKADGT